MSTWVDTYFPENLRNHFKTPPCGTVACLAGSAMVLEAKRLGLETWHQVCRPDENYEQFGMRYFNLDKDQIEALFYATQWPIHYGTLYEHFASDFFHCRHPHVVRYIKKQMVHILELRIEFFIRTNGTDNAAEPQEQY